MDTLSLMQAMWAQEYWLLSGNMCIQTTCGLLAADILQLNVQAFNWRLTGALEAITNAMFCISVGNILSFDDFPFEYLEQILQAFYI